MIPVSTLEFLFQRFDMIERLLDELKSLEVRTFSSPGCSAVLAGIATADSGKLATSISALEEKIEKQSILLNDIDCKCKLLPDDNVNFKNAINDAQHAVKNFSSASHGVSLNNGSTARNDCPVINDKYTLISPYSILAKLNDLKSILISRGAGNGEICITNRIKNWIQTRHVCLEGHLLLHR